ncbi:MAG: hypothetical protein WCS84_05975 [Nocardioides sp.]|jgi:hypothetical protein
MAEVDVETRGGSGLVVVPAADLRDFLTAGPGYLPSVASLL